MPLPANKMCPLLLPVLLSACQAWGPTEVVPRDAQFDGIEDLLGEAEGSSLNILLVHGMRVTRDERYTEIVDTLVDRLALEYTDGTDDPIPLGEKWVSQARFQGNALWPEDEWERGAPTLDIQYFRTEDGKEVNFYVFNYWRGLASIKCRKLVEPDTHLIGRSALVDICRDPDLAPGMKVHDRAAAKPELLNKLLKTELMEWGFADAVIALSGYEKVLNEALQEAVRTQINDVAARERLKALGSSTDDSTAVGLVARQAQEDKARFAVISHSLGSYVLFNALTPLDAPRVPEEVDEQQRKAIFENYLLENHAPLTLLCNTRQVHMLANQIPLLALAGISMGMPGESLGFEGLEQCNAIQQAMAGPVAGTPDASERLQVVAYHEPNDALTYFLDPSLYRMPQTFDFYNVVSSFSTVWVPWLLANPVDAHTAQMEDGGIVDLLVSGNRRAD